MKYLRAFLIILTLPACAQHKTDRSVGGECEGCEAIFEYATKKLTPIDTLADFSEADGPRIKITGTIFQRDGKTPAGDVILYIYHTDQKGYYTPGENAKDWAKRHGRLRGWIKTNSSGQYTFYTLLPASYPNSDNPKHIHPVIKEPGIQAYWIDEFLFEGDPLLTEKQKSHCENRGGPGFITLQMDRNKILVGRRDIILGKNIPGYK